MSMYMEGLALDGNRQHVKAIRIEVDEEGVVAESQLGGSSASHNTYAAMRHSLAWGKQASCMVPNLEADFDRRLQGGLSV